MTPHTASYYVSLVEKELKEWQEGTSCQLSQVSDGGVRGMSFSVIVSTRWGNKNCNCSMVSSAKKASAGFSVYWSFRKNKHTSIKIQENTNHSQVLRAVKGNFKVCEISLLGISSICCYFLMASLLWNCSLSLAFVFGWRQKNNRLMCICLYFAYSFSEILRVPVHPELHCL